MSGPVLWPAGTDARRIADEVGRQFPGVRAWWGVYTGAWWALARDRYGRYRLVEAADPAGLRRRLEELGVRSAWGRITSPSGGNRPRS
jgi:hypothetical protein